MDDGIADSSDFRISVLALMLFSDWLLRYGTILQPEHFPVDAEKLVVKWLNSYYDKYHACPSDSDIRQGLNDNPLLQILFQASNEDLRFAADHALEFAKMQAMKQAIMRSVDDIKANKLQDIRPRIEQALAVGGDRLNLGWELVKDVKQWMYDELHGKHHPTGWPDIDNLLGGGLVAGEYGLIMAAPGRGKTTALINIGYALAGILGAVNVLHITLEMPVQKVLKRYAVRLTGQPYHRSDTLENESGFSSLLLNSAARNLKARLRVAKPVKRTVESIRQLIDNLTGQDFETGALIVDYADLLLPGRKRDETRFELADIARDLRDGIGADYDIPIWSATQAGRQALYKEVVTIADIAEAIEKAAIADVILAICQTRDEEKLGQGRIFGAKMRDAKGSFMMSVKIDFTRQLIVQRGKMEL